MEFADQYYEMNPDAEDLIPNGTGLQEGMVVLIESPKRRQDLGYVEETPTTAMGKEFLNRAKLNNQWCAISNINVYHKLVTFMATYPDGVKRKRSHEIHDAWIVKLDSLPTETRNDPVDVVKKGMLHNMIWRALEEYDSGESNRHEIAETLTEDILKAVGIEPGIWNEENCFPGDGD